MKTKSRISVAVDKNINDLLNSEFSNKSKYIEWLIYKDLLKNSKNKKIKNIIL